MDSMFKFIQTVSEIFEYRYQLKIDPGNPFEVLDLPFEDLTGSEIRKRRLNITTQVTSIIRNYGPWTIGVDAPDWVWAALTQHLIDEPIPSSSLFNIDYLKWDPSVPGAVWSNERLVLKDIWAGGRNVYYMGEKIDGKAVEREIFCQRASNYILSILSQAAQICRKENAVVEAGPVESPPPEEQTPLAP